MRNLLLLFFEFFKTGLFAVGGGLATIPFLKEISAKYPYWFSLTELSNMIAVGNATPGPIGVNMATYAGVTARGVLGGLIVTAGIVLPSFIIILIISKILDKFQNSIVVKGAFSGLRPAVVAMITVVLFELAKATFFKTGYDLLSRLKLKELILFAVMFIFTRIYKKNHTILYIAVGAVVGVIFKF